MDNLRIKTLEQMIAKSPSHKRNEKGANFPLQASKLQGKTTTYDSEGNPVDSFESDVSSIMEIKGSKSGTLKVKKKALESLYNPDVNYLKSVI